MVREQADRAGRIGRNRSFGNSFRQRPNISPTKKPIMSKPESSATLCKKQSRWNCLPILRMKSKRISISCRIITFERQRSLTSFTIYAYFDRFSRMPPLKGTTLLSLWSLGKPSPSSDIASQQSAPGTVRTFWQKLPDRFPLFRLIS